VHATASTGRGYWVSNANQPNPLIAVVLKRGVEFCKLAAWAQYPPMAPVKSEFNLALDETVYRMDIPVEKGRKAPKAMCKDFVAQFITNHFPNKIKVAVSDGPIPNGMELKVSRIGYYRWVYRGIDGYWKSGMFRAAEDVVRGIFPDSPMHIDTEHSRWVNVWPR